MSDDTLDIGNLPAGDASEGFDAADAAVVSEARAHGWVPEDQWRGDPSDWVDAHTYVRKGREVRGLLRKELDTLRKEKSDLEARLAAQGATVAELREYMAKLEQRATENVMKSLKAEKRDAIASGDMVRADEIEEQIDALKASESAVPKPKDPVPQPTVHPEVAAWMARNPWFSDENPELVDYCNGATLSLIQAKQRAGQSFTPTSILEEVTERARKAFPQHFHDGAAAMFDGGGHGGGGGTPRSSGRKSGFASLDADARAQFQRFYDAGYYVDLKTGKKLDLAVAQAEYFKEYR